MACSTSRTVGLTSRSMNARTVSTSIDFVVGQSLYGHPLTPYARIAHLMTSGPYFDELQVGQVFDCGTGDDADRRCGRAAPGDPRGPVAAAAGRRAVRGRSPGRPTPLAHPGLVCDVAIGQSTLVTQRVKANLFYRGLAFHRFPVIGDTLFTRTEVVGLKQNSAKPGPGATGLAALRMTTIDQADRLVLDFYRCAMLPLAPDAGRDRPRRRPVRDRRRRSRRRRRRRPRDWDGEVFRRPGARPALRPGSGRARCCTAPATSSAAHRSWLG